MTLQLLLHFSVDIMYLCAILCAVIPPLLSEVSGGGTFCSSVLFCALSFFLLLYFFLVFFFSFSQLTFACLAVSSSPSRGMLPDGV